MNFVEEKHAEMHASGVPEFCTCWGNCECRKTTCNPSNAPVIPVLDMDGRELVFGDVVEFICIGHERTSECPSPIRFHTALRYAPPIPGRGLDYVDRGDFFAESVRGEVTVGHGFTFHRTEARENDYRKHDIRWCGRAEDPVIRHNRIEAERKRSTFLSGASEDIRKRFLAWIGQEDFDGVTGGSHEDFVDELFAMRFAFLMVLAREEDWDPIEGTDDEDEALDKIGHGEDSGKWMVWRWTGAVWEEASIKRDRKTREVKIAWRPKWEERA